MLFKFIVIICCYYNISVLADNHKIVQINDGILRGKIQHSVFNKIYYSFRGIPYATAPIGNLRFRDAKPVQKWDGIKDALDYGHMCPQIDIRNMFYTPEFETEIQGNEDCLFLNVFTTALPKDANDNFKPRSVLFFIHGGGFFSGCGDDFLFGPDFLIEENVVLVTINYRLGGLGFLSLENEEVPGNFGLKDQILALKWVQENIAAFGGDPNSVTIFGQSAGGASTSLLMVSPLAEGLFHKVMSLSGSFMNSWAMNSLSLKNRAFKLAHFLGKDTDDNEELMKFLRFAPANKIAELSGLLKPDPFDEIPEFSKTQELTFVPTVEPEEVGSRAFLTNDPEDILLNGKYTQLPMMIGDTSQELIFFMQNKDLELENVKSVIEDLKINLPFRNLKLPFNSASYKHVIEVIKETFSLNEVNEDTPSNYVALISSLWISLGSELFSRMQARVSKEKTYTYQVAYDGSYNLVKRFRNLTIPGTSHGDELCYIFACRDYLDLYKSLDKNTADYKMIKVWSKLFTNFAKTGNPTPDKDDILDNVQWLPRTEDNPQNLIIDNPLKMDKITTDNIVNKWLYLLNYIKNSQGKNSVESHEEL